MRRLLLAGAALALASCATGPDYVSPLPEASRTAALATGNAAPAEEALHERWWQLFERPELDPLIAEALAANTDLRQAIANIEVARAIGREASAGRLPSTTLSGGYLYGRNAIADALAAANGGDASNVWTTTGTAAISYEADLFGRVSRGIEAAVADVGGAEAARDSVRLTVVADVTRAYATACSAGEQLALAQQLADLASGIADLIQRQREAGAASEVELARYRLLASQAREAIPVFAAQRRIAAFELAALMGRPPKQAPDEALACETHLTLARPLPVGDGASLLRRRPDVRRDERRLAAATARIGVATASLYPRISFGADVGYTRNQFLQGTNSLTLGVGPLFSFSFPNMAVARARIAQARGGAAAALAQFDGTVLRALKEVDQAVTLLEGDAQRSQAVQRSLADATRAFTLAKDRRSAGATGDLELYLAEQAYIAAALAAASAEAKVADDQIQLFRSLGGGWQQEGPGSP